MNDSLFDLTLDDGLPGMTENGTERRYHKVKLRETTVRDERKAVALAERVVDVPGEGHKLLVSQSVYTDAITMLHIEHFSDGSKEIGQDIFADNFRVIEKLSEHDWELVEARVTLIRLSAKLRYGDISQKLYDEYLESLGQGKKRGEPEGDTEELDKTDHQPQPAVTRIAPKT